MSKQSQALNAISQILEWDYEQDNREFGWLRFMAGYKFDYYQDFLAGARFIESLAIWLQQFSRLDERQIAYDFLRKHLLFLSAPEMNHLVERFYPRVVAPDLIARAAQKHDIPSYRVWSNPDAKETMKKMRRRILFMGLSDGAKIDVLRRANATLLTNEQIVMQPFLDNEKWRDLSKELKKDEILAQTDSWQFDTVYIIDDITASGTTFIRKSGGQWKGKLVKLWNSLKEARSSINSDFPIVSSPSVHVHHYIVTKRSRSNLQERELEIRKERAGDWFEQEIKFTEGMILPDSFSINSGSNLIALTNNYYDESLEDNIHVEESGNKDMRTGYAQCALPLVLEHNTPNNSISLLWAETNGTKGHAMHPLFRRRQRHS